MTPVVTGALVREVDLSELDEVRELLHAYAASLPFSLEKALALHTSLGFREIGPYRPNPIAGARFLELEL